ncbi:TPA: hypothetical protein ACH3X1_008982 [Trebouxia sp. C0004]
MLVLNSCKVRYFRALEHIDSVTSDRFLKLQDATLQQCHETDESDLNRLRKHFKTLKNTFTVYDLKEGFIDGLLQGLPDGSEEDQLYQFEEEMEKNSMLLRQYKSTNEQAQSEVIKMMEELVQTRQQYTTQRDLCAAQLQELHEEQAQYETEQSQMPPPLQVDYAALQVECAAALQAETTVQRGCEVVYASHQANIQELEADMRSAAVALRTLESQVASMEEMRKSEAKESQVNHRFVEHMQWCDAMVSALEALSGVSVASVNSDRLEIRLTARIDPSQPPPPGASSKTFEHTLLMQTDSSTSTVQHAELQPEDVDIQDIATAAVASQQGASFVVRETQARLRHHLIRNQMLEEASAQFQLVPSTLEDGVFQVQVPNGGTANIRVSEEWPNTDADVTLLGVQSAAGPLTVDEIIDQVAHHNHPSTNSLLAVLNAVVARVK